MLQVKKKIPFKHKWKTIFLNFFNKKFFSNAELF